MNNIGLEFINLLQKFICLNFSIIISTCDKFSDLWDAHILLLNQNWADRNVETFLVTDKPTDRTFENVTVVAAGEGTEITERLKVVLPLIKTEYVLFTLDDYFLSIIICRLAARPQKMWLQRQSNI